MKASVGDPIIVASPAVDGPVRDGEIVELHNADGSPPYVVRWSDTGHTGLFFPGADAQLSPGHDVEPVAPLAVPHVRSWRVNIDLFESGDDTSAHAVLIAESPQRIDTRELTSLRASLKLAGENARPFRVGGRLSSHVRHQHKYATTPLPTQRRFYFHHADGEVQAAAATLEDFSRHLRHCDLATLDYHLTRGDFSRWVIGTLADHELGAGLATIERDLSLRRAAELERARWRIVDVIERRYLRHADT